ncbi:putative protein kinase RLK-Pelle-CrRLK1L-1 family [Helianthus debilis subsp. tardiflorus]
MDAFLQQVQHLKIPLEEIILATNNFNKENYIGRGGFGKVYKGQLSHSKGRSTVAINRLDQRHGQGIPEFLKEITTLSSYRHENLICLLGFCCQASEMILVYEHASRGSLDRHLNSPDLTWSQRLKICLDAAQGLRYLHDQRGTHQRLIHCDVKSSNILLDDNWNGKVSDFGLSKTRSANEQQSLIVTMAAGTFGYIDPLYRMTSTLTKESEVYSFGVVLLEVLCGRLCMTYSNGRVEQYLVSTWIRSYEENKLNEIIFNNPTIQPMDRRALEIFSDIAYQCLKKHREDRPRMADVVIKLETALEIQEFSEENTLFDYVKMTKSAEPPLNYRSEDELMKLLYKGVLLNDGKTWFSLNKKGEHCEMISFAECVGSGPSEFESKCSSRFGVGTYPYSYEDGSLKTHVQTQFLLPEITYTVNLVFKFILPEKARKEFDLISLKYKLQGESKTSISYLASEREDGWWMCELYQFTSDHRIVDLQIEFDGFDRSSPTIEVEGFEFQPLEKVVEHIDENQPISDSDSDPNWEEKMPTDYVDMMELSTKSVRWKRKKEAYSIMCKGFLINDGQKWFSLDKNGKKGHMLSARAACIKGRMHTHLLSLPESRFGEVAMLRLWRFSIISKIKSQLLSSQTTYACYLVYKFPKDQSGFEAPVKVKDKECTHSDRIWYIYLERPRTPLIRSNANQNSHNPLNRPTMKGLPKQRNDGWMEVQIWEFKVATATTTETIPMHLTLSRCGSNKPDGLIIEGVELRPI